MLTDNSKNCFSKKQCHHSKQEENNYLVLSVPGTDACYLKTVGSAYNTELSQPLSYNLIESLLLLIYSLSKTNEHLKSMLSSFYYLGPYGIIFAIL